MERQRVREVSAPRHNDLNRRARVEFMKLTREQVVEAVANMAGMGFSDYTIGSATGLSVESVRQLLGERRGQT